MLKNVAPRLPQEMIGDLIMYWKLQLIQEIGHPQGFSKGISHRSVFSLYGGARDNILLLSRPANWIVTKEQEVDLFTNSITDVPRPIRIGLHLKIKVINGSHTQA